MAERNYARSLDYEMDYIIIQPGTGRGAKEAPIVIHDQKKGIHRWLGCSIIEDLFRNFTTCDITIHDVDGFYLNRLRCEEMVQIQFKTPDFPDKKFKKRLHNFYIYKIDPIVIMERPASATYVLRCISYEYLFNALQTFSSSYTNHTEKIAGDIYQKYLVQKSGSAAKIAKKFKAGRPTKHKMKFTFPYMNPVDAINHLASVSIDAKNPSICNYVFYENTDGFNFKSITEMIEKPRKIHKYITTNVVIGSFMDYRAHFDKTISALTKRTGDKIIDTLDGVYGEEFMDFDILYKTATVFFGQSADKSDASRKTTKLIRGKRYEDEFKKTKHLNEFPLLSSDVDLFDHPLGRNRICFSNKALYSEKIQLKDGSEEWELYETHEEEYSFQRRSMMQQINTFTMELTVSGNSDITVGDIIEYDGIIYKTEDKDKFLSGRYLVAAVNHYINGEGYRCIITVSRDSITSDGSEKDAKAAVK